MNETPGRLHALTFLTTTSFFEERTVMATVNDTQVEEFRPIAGFPGYEVSNLGRVRSFWFKQGIGVGCGTRRRIGANPAILKTWSDSGGYAMVTIYAPGIPRMIPRKVKVAHLVLETFVSTMPDGMLCKHGPKGQNCDFLDNLCWGTAKENMADRVRDGTDERGEKHHFAKLTNEQAREIKFVRLPRGETTKEIAAEFGVSYQSVGDIRAGRTWEWLKE